MSRTNREREPDRTQAPGEDDHHPVSANLRNDVLLIVFLIGMLLFHLSGAFTQIFGLDTALLVTLVGGYGIFWNSLKRLAQGRLDGDLAVTIAVAAAIGIGQYAAAAEVVLIVLIGKTLESWTVGRTRNAIASLLPLLPQTAIVLRDGKEIAVPREALQVGDRLILRPGERIPADGIVRRGQSGIDQSLLTGESTPVARGEGETVYAGSLNGTGLLEIEATGVGGQTTLAEIARLVAEAQARKSPTQQVAERWGRLFVPLVLAVGAVTFGVWYIGMQASLEVALTRMASALIIACPCALLLATPTGIAAALGRGARHGILIRGGAALEALSQINCVVFDKTGTLTQGRPEVVEAVGWNGHSEQETLRLAATAEQGSAHPLAPALRAAYQKSASPAPLPTLDRTEERPGQGLVAWQGAHRLLVGNATLLAAFGLRPPPEGETHAEELQAAGRTVVFVAEDAAVYGLIALADPIRPEAATVIAALRRAGLERFEMLTGDSARVAASVAAEIGLSDYRAELLPAGKAARVRQLQAEGCRVAFLGDGINDAPALATANVGIALGPGGADLALEAADVVFFHDSLQCLPEALALGRRALQVIERNLLLYGIGLNALSVLVSATGLLALLGVALQTRWPALFGNGGRDLSPLLAAVVHQIASLLVVGSALHLLTARTLSEARPGPSPRPALLQTLRQRIRTWTAIELLISIGEGIAEMARANRSRARALLGGSVLLLWLLSGFYTTPPGQVGVVQRFGRLLSANVSPGLHYRLPWPIERVTLVDISGVRRAEIGYRTVAMPLAPTAGVSASEWSSTHGGSVQRVAEESLLLTGDAYLTDVNLTLQYRVASPERFLFHTAESETLLREAGEAALRKTVGRVTLESLLTTGRAALEAEIRSRTQQDCDRAETGLVVLEARIQEAHPPQEVVDAYRDVSSATEEKATAINEAEAYRNETIPQARGEAEQNVALANGATFDRIHRAAGDGDRFLRTLQGFRTGPAVNTQRLYLEAVEQALLKPGKYIMDANGSGRRQLWLSDGSLYGPPIRPPVESPAPFPPATEQ